MSLPVRGRGAAGGAADALQTALAAEFLSPGPRLVVHAPALADPPLLDNRQNAFRTLLPDLGHRDVRLSDVVVELLLRGTDVDVGVRDRAASAAAIDALERATRREAPGGRLRLLVAPDLPGAGLLLSGFALVGDLAWTTDGVSVGPRGAEVHVGPEADAAGAAWRVFWEENGDAAHTVR